MATDLPVGVGALQEKSWPHGEVQEGSCPFRRYGRWGLPAWDGGSWKTENLSNISSICLPFQAVPQGAETTSRPLFLTKRSR